MMCHCLNEYRKQKKIMAPSKLNLLYTLTSPTRALYLYITNPFCRLKSSLKILHWRFVSSKL